MSSHLQVAGMMLALIVLAWGQTASEAADVSGRPGSLTAACTPATSGCTGPARYEDNAGSAISRPVRAPDPGAPSAGGCQQRNSSASNVNLNAPIASCDATDGRADGGHGGGCDQTNSGEANVNVNAPIASCNRGSSASGSDDANTSGRACSQSNSGRNVANVNAPIASCNG